MVREPILQFFDYAHLPPKLQEHSKPFWALAQYLCRTLPQNAERTTALRKLLEAKDCAVRSSLFDITKGEVATSVPMTDEIVPATAA
jgi:ferritin-like protein